MSHLTSHHLHPPFSSTVPTAPLVSLSISKLLSSDKSESLAFFAAAQDLGFIYLGKRVRGCISVHRGYLQGYSVWRVFHSRFRSCSVVSLGSELVAGVLLGPWPSYVKAPAPGFQQRNAEPRGQPGQLGDAHLLLPELKLHCCVLGHESAC